MVWCELLVINNSSERVWETAWRDEGYEVKAVEGGDIDLSPGETQKNWMIPKKGFLGVECGVGGTWTSRVESGGSFRVCISIPASGDDRYEVRSNSSNLGARLTYHGKGGRSNAHRYNLVLPESAPREMKGVRPDSRLRVVESLPGVGYGVSLGHAIAGEEDQARRAAGTCTNSVLSTAGGMLGPLGAAAGAVVGGAVERGVNHAVAAEHQSDKGTSFNVGEMLKEGAAAGAGGKASAGAGAAFGQAQGLVQTAQRHATTAAASTAGSTATKKAMQHLH